MKIFRWVLGTIVLLVILALIILRPFSSVFFTEDTANFEYVIRFVYILILAACLVLFRVLGGPTAADRVVAIDILGILIVGLCAVLTIATNKSWYIDIGIAWALQSFIGALALSKYLEGRGFDE